MLKNMPENMIEAAVLELKKAREPIYIWGGKQYATKTKRYLNSKGVKIDGFLINKEYMEKDLKELCGCPVYELEEFLTQNRCIMVVAFAGYREGQLGEYTNRVEKVYALDFIGKLALEEVDGTIYWDFYNRNRSAFEWLEERLADEISKEALNDYIFQKMAGSYRKDNFELNQYFPEDIIRLQEQEIFVDCGAYQGETVVDFIEHLQRQKVSAYKKIVAIEAEKENFMRMKNNLKAYSDIEPVCAGVWCNTDVLRICSGYGANSSISNKGTECISVRTIDDILGGKPATYIKMDIEGSELKALYGAKETIEKYKPKLAVCIYHKPEDLIEIPRYINELRGDYQFYIRNHSPHGIEAVLYAV